MKIISDSREATLRIGRSISRYFKSQDVICLYGQLGSGKTVLTKGIASGLGIDKEKVISPTFVLIRQYEGKIPVYHFDLYRLQDPQEIADLGYEEYIYGQGISVIEWPDRLGYLLPAEYLKVELDVEGKDKRKLVFSACGKRYQKLLEKINEDISR